MAILFFVLALVAAYTNRSMLFEQRTSANQYRALQAAEAAEAGVEWALSMLNTGRSDDNCQPTAHATEPPFRDRYLAIAPDTGAVRPTGTLGADGGSDRWPTCVFDGTGWDCRCPTDGVGTPPAPAGGGVFPAFRIRFVDIGGAPPGAVRLEVNGCTRLADECLDFPVTGVGGEGRATHRVPVALRGGLAAPPVAAVTVRGTLDAGGAALGAFNGDADAGGIAILAGGAVDGPALRVGSAPGTPLSGANVADDTGLAGLPDGERFFTSSFALPSASYRAQPGAVVLDCATVPCSGDRVRGVAERHPGHVLWADGDVDLGAGAEIGTPTAPVLLVVTGDIALDTTLHGLLYGRAGAWSGAGTVRGALMVEGDYAGTAAYDVVYDPGVLQRLRWRTGSFVRVPGSWRDY